MTVFAGTEFGKDRKVFWLNVTKEGTVMTETKGVSSTVKVFTSPLKILPWIYTSSLIPTETVEPTLIVPFFAPIKTGGALGTGVLLIAV